MNLGPITLSLKVASLATLASVAGGLALIGLAARLRPGQRNIFRVAATLPLVLPPTVLGYYLLVLLSRGSALGRLFKSLFGFDLVFTWQAAVVAAAVASFPLFFMTAMPAFEAIDESIINAARTLGKSDWQIYWRIKLPLAWRGILSGVSLAFSRALGDFGATLMIAGNIPGRTQTAPLAIYDYVVSGNRTAANQLVIITTVIGIALLSTGTWAVHRKLKKRDRYIF